LAYTVAVKVSWDDAKNFANQGKHGLSFEEAQAVFATEDYLEVFDEEHSDREERFIAIGLIHRGLIVVVWALADDETRRIISARPATKNEAKLYESYMGKKHD
jgi:uncharacterized DUF497 family protein